MKIRSQQQNTFNQISDAARPGVSAGPIASESQRRSTDVGGPPPFLSTRFQRKETARRKRLLDKFNALVANGATHEAAAKECRASVPTLWRWKTKHVEPTTANCGRKTKLEELAPSPEILSLVRQLQLGGKSNADAWHAVADDTRCPAPLRDYLKNTRTISPSLLAVTRLTRRKLTVIEAPEATVIVRRA